jgi:perosamine synthetase
MRNGNSAKEITDRLAKKGIGTRPFFWPLHKQPLLKKFDISLNQSHPVSEEISKTGFYLPSGVGTTEEQIKRSAISLLEVI